MPIPGIEPLVGRSHPDVVPIRVVKACTIAYRTVYELNVTNSFSIFLWRGLSLLPQHQKRRSLASCVRLTPWSLQCRPASTGLIGQSGDSLNSTHELSLLTLHRLTAKEWPLTSWPGTPACLSAIVADSVPLNVVRLGIQAFLLKVGKSHKLACSAISCPPLWLCTATSRSSISQAHMPCRVNL